MSYWRFFYHVVWATRGREPTIRAVDNDAIVQSIRQVCDGLELIPHAIGWVPDHIHLALSIPPKISVSDAIRRIKGASSHAINESRGMARPRFGWQPTYGAITFSERGLSRVVEYVLNQPQHHANGELIKLLEQIAEK
jgi:putative transposase